MARQATVLEGTMTWLSHRCGSPSGFSRKKLVARSGLICSSSRTAIFQWASTRSSSRRSWGPGWASRTARRRLACRPGCTGSCRSSLRPRRKPRGWPWCSETRPQVGREVRSGRRYVLGAWGARPLPSPRSVETRSCPYRRGPRRPVRRCSGAWIPREQKAWRSCKKALGRSRAVRRRPARRRRARGLAACRGWQARRLTEFLGGAGGAIQPSKQLDTSSCCVVAGLSCERGYASCKVTPVRFGSTDDLKTETNILFRVASAADPQRNRQFQG